MKLTARELFVTAAQRGEVGTRAGTPLEQHAFGLGEVHDGFHVVLHRVDEAGRALRLGLHADVEPDRRIETHFLLDQQMRQIVAKSVARGIRRKVGAALAPADDGIDDAADELAHGVLPLGSIELAVKIF
jgi:hypothetical protein